MTIYLVILSVSGESKRLDISLALNMTKFFVILRLPFVILSPLVILSVSEESKTTKRVAES
ncbi:hypothetical protein ACRE1U_00375 [Helicobacter himalayensis]|uniref:hypothetical protein n=1 Tax=Helicobacter himalayensis TaxID=1591088 RepID=UPI003D6EBB57